MSLLESLIWDRPGGPSVTGSVLMYMYSLLYFCSNALVWKTVNVCLIKEGPDFPEN